MSNYRPEDFGMNDISVVSKRDPNAKRITREEVVTLKLKVVSGEKKIAPIGVHFGRMLRTLMSMCTVTADTPRNQCKRYGHVLPVGVAYSSHNLHCGECGKKIRTPDELRTVNPRHEREMATSGKL